MLMMVVMGAYAVCLVVDAFLCEGWWVHTSLLRQLLVIYGSCTLLGALCVREGCLLVAWIRCIFFWVGGWLCLLTPGISLWS